jgi:disulfide bond formation protein DsbB
VSVHRAIARLIENRGPCISASGSLVLQHGHATKPCFFCPRTRIGFGFPAGAGAVSRNLKI